LDELNIEIIRNTLYKAYLEDFYQFCESIGGPTAEVMGDILRVSKSFFFYTADDRKLKFLIWI
jgi:vacuolar-type H+-ATPase subunit C/Vma6